MVRFQNGNSSDEWARIGSFETDAAAGPFTPATPWIAIPQPTITEYHSRNILY